MEYDVVNYTDALVNAILFFVSFFILFRKKKCFEKGEIMIIYKKNVAAWMVGSFTEN